MTKNSQPAGLNSVLRRIDIASNRLSMLADYAALIRPMHCHRTMPQLD